MSAIIAEKKIVIKAIDQVTEPLARMNQRLTHLEQTLGQFNQKMSAGSSDQQSFKTSLNELKASASETDTALGKINHTIKEIPKSKKVDVGANTSEAKGKVDDFKKTVDLLRKDKPKVKPEADTSQAESKLRGLQRTTESVGHSFTRLRTIIAGTAIGSAISTGFTSAISTVKNGIIGAMHAGVEFNMTMQKMNATWDTLTGSASKAKGMSNQIVDLSNKLGWDVDVTNELAQQFYHVFDNQPETMKLTKSFLTMGDAIGLSSDRLKQVGMDFTHMLSSSKLQLGDLNQITDAFPMFGEALLKYERKVQHNSHLTMSQLRKDISAGKISAKDAEKVFNQLGDKYKKASENLMGTLPGMFRQIQSKWKQLMGDMMAPSTDAANPIVKQISKWIGSENTTKEFEKLGRTINNGVGAIMKSLANTFGDGSVSKMLDNMVNSLTRFTKAASDWTADNAGSIVKTISSIARITGSLGKGAFDAISDFLRLIGHTFGGGLKGIADSLENISQHRVALNLIGRTVATYFAYNKLSKAASSLKDMYDSLHKIASLSATKIAAVMEATQGNYDGSNKFLQGLSDGITQKQVSKKVGPSGVLAEEASAKSVGPMAVLQGEEVEATMAGDRAGKNFVSKLLARIRTTRIGGKIATIFAGSETTAGAAGTRVGTSFVGRLGLILASPKILSVGKAVAGKLGAGIAIGLSAIDFLRGITPSFKSDRWKMIGKGAGGLICAGIGGYLGGPPGAAIGSLAGNFIGGHIGKGVHSILKGMYNLGYDLGEALQGKLTFNDMKKKFHSAWSGIVSWAQKEWSKFTHWWNQDTSDAASKNAKVQKKKQPSEKEIKSLGGNHYSKTDIANVKEMNRAITAYTRSLRSLKQVVKRNDPTKALNLMNKNLKSFIKEMQKTEKPLDKISKTFKTFGKATKTMANSIKELTGKHGLNEFDKDITKLEKDTKHSKIGEYFEKIAKSIEKSKLTKQFKDLNKFLTPMVKTWEKLSKPMKQVEKAFTSFGKTIGKLTDKKSGLSKVDSDIKTLSKDLKKYDFGKELGKQMQTASKQLKGKNSFVKQFTNMTRSIEKELKTFHKNFTRDWGGVWKNLSGDAVRGLLQVVKRANASFNQIRGAERRFASGFLSSWRSWINGVVSSFRSGFNKLAGIAERSMKDIISRLNRGITAINSVISDFGGDKHLNSISYASGTSMAGGSGSGYSAHPGGEAVINDGKGPHKQELVWQPSKGWQLYAGLNRRVWLEPGAQIIPGERSHRILSRMHIPHYAYGNLSREQLDRIEDEFMSDPMDAAKQLILGVTNWDSSIPLIPSFGKASAIGFAHGIANVLKTAVGTVKHAIGGDWGPAISSAARHMWAKISRGFRDELKQVIQNESGGIETRIQDAAVDDVNMRNGNPAQGLLQYIPQTFAKYAMPGHGNILAGFDQLMAFFNNTDYLHSIGFNSILHKIDWLGSGPTGGRRYASGGHITSEENAWIADNPEHDEYVINPYNANAIPLLNQAWDTVKLNRPELVNSQSVTTSPQVISLLKAAVDKLDNINMTPILRVEDARRAINKDNAMDYARINI